MTTTRGDDWDHVALDPEHRLVVGVVSGARTIENTEALVEDFRRRTGGRLMNLMTSDDDPASKTAILHAYGETVTPPRTGKLGRPAVSHLSLYSSNFCWAVRTLSVADDEGQRSRRSPAMAAGLTNHIWSMAEGYPVPPSCNAPESRGTSSRRGICKPFTPA